MDVLDRMGKTGHPEEDYLERYVMNSCTEQETNAIEEHLLVCENCRVRLYGVEEWVSLMKTAIPLGPTRKRVPRWRQALGDLRGWQGEFFAHPMGMAAGCAALAAVLIAAPILLREQPLQEETVALAATRGVHAEPSADSRHLLRLKIDTTGLVAPMEGQIVDATGQLVMSQPLTETAAQMKLDRPLKPGTYWVRVNSGAAGKPTLREFLLLVH